MDKLEGTCIVLLLHHAHMEVKSKAFHTSLTGHTSEHHQWAGGGSFCSGIYSVGAVNVYGVGAVK